MKSMAKKTWYNTPTTIFHKTPPTTSIFFLIRGPVASAELWPKSSLI